MTNSSNLQGNDPAKVAPTRRSQMPLPNDQVASGRSFDHREIENVVAALESGTLTSTKGTFTKEFECGFAGLLGARFAYACSSGTSALHCSIAAIDPEPGDEIIVSPITDMGALAPVLYQGAIPVFADVDPLTLNLTASSIEERLSERTRAIMVTHLFGSPAEMTKIVSLAQKHGLPIIEDCAQAFLAEQQSQLTGTIGDIGCFSLQQGKHITTGEGGIVVTNDEALARRMFLFINKAWGYGDAQPDHYFLALNSRMSELQGAVAGAQLEKLPQLVELRITAAERLTQALRDTPGLMLPRAQPGDRHVYWRYPLHLDLSVLPQGPGALSEILKRDQIYTAPRYIQKPAFRCQVFAEQRTFGDSRWPFSLARPEAINYSEERFPGAFGGLESVLVVPLNERYQDHHIDFVASRIKAACEQLRSS